MQQHRSHLRLCLPLLVLLSCSLVSGTHSSSSTSSSAHNHIHQALPAFSFSLSPLLRRAAFGRGTDSTGSGRVSSGGISSSSSSARRGWLHRIARQTKGRVGLQVGISMPLTQRRGSQTKAAHVGNASLSSPRGSPGGFVHLGKLKVPFCRRMPLRSSSGESGGESDGGVVVVEREGEQGDGERRIISYREAVWDENDKPSAVPFGVGKNGKGETVQIPMRYNVGEAVDFLRKLAAESSASAVGLSAHDRVYLTEKGELKGFIPMSALLTNTAFTALEDIMCMPEMVLREGDSWEESAFNLRAASVMAAPVVDENQHLVAVLNAEDLLLEMEIETTDDISRRAGAGPAGESYFGTPLHKLVMSRCGWLVSLLMLQSLSSVILTAFQSVIERNIVIALFLTMLTGTAGNAGNQSSAMVIRGIATGEITKKNAGKCVRREAKAAFAASLILSLASFARVLLTPGSTLSASIAVSVAMGLTVIGAILFGTITPIVLDRWGMDPVNFASPALATLTDVTGVLILCTTAKVLLR